jgi:hypothetical protein
MMNGVCIGEVLYPPRVRNVGRGKPSVSLTLGRREEMKPEMTPSLLPISESVPTRVVLTISESATTQFPLIILR